MFRTKSANTLEETVESSKVSAGDDGFRVPLLSSGRTFFREKM